MDNKKIIEMLLQKMMEGGFWFTTKNDPTYEEASTYYELDEYGDLTEKSQTKICNEIQDLLGDGAVAIEDAIDLWMSDASVKYQIGYIEDLVTTFEPKPVVDQIEAYENPIPLAENRLKEVKLDGMITDFPDDLYIDLKNQPNKEWTKEDQDAYEKRYIDSRMAILNGDSENKSIIFKQDADRYGVKGLTFSKDTIENDIKELAKAYANAKETKYKELNENYKKNLQERNNESLNTISAKFTDPNFDSDSPDGQIVMRTSELFNALSDKGYDISVSFDNGESQSIIPMGQQGGQIIITINNANKPLRAFASGNFEIIDENIDALKDIQEQISAL